MGITDSSAFCVLPWMHLRLNPDGTAALCCHAPGGLIDDNGARLNAQTHTFRDIWNAAALKDVRRRMAAGEQVALCDGCWNAERLGLESFRHQANAQWLDEPLRAAIDAAANWNAPSDPLYFDLSMGNLCNLKCTVCKPLYSSQIERDPVHSRWIENAPYYRLPSRFGDGDWSQAPALIDEMMELSGNVASIQLVGGEPTINRTQLGWLQRLAEAGRAGDIEVVMSSNLVSVPPRVLDLLGRFKAVKIWISIDGVGAVYEYVRYPARWPFLVRNIERTRMALPKAELAINFTLQALNLEVVADFIRWATGTNLPVHIELARGLDHFNDVRILPPGFRKLQRARIEDATAGAIDEEVLRNNVGTVFAEIEATDFGDNARAVAAFGLMQFVNDMDHSRHRSFRAAAPATFAAITDYCCGWDERGATVVS